MTTIGKPTYEELEKKCALQQSKLAAINELMSVVEKASDIAKAGIEELQSQNADLAVQLANAESKCRDLAAENAKLADCANFYRLGFKPVKGTFGIEWKPTEQLLDDCGNTAIEAIKTPATDAFLAEVRAQGVEMYAEHLTRKAIASGENKNHAYAYLAANFAAQLRKGGAV
ncbi:hypothetical protein B9P90_20765 [Citrobacter freundii]|uniref:Ead/Ea22-like family protein n=1 Tax=Citrobacter freundii TaxID=546 RepID=A0AA44SJ16_CITFR|nr:hypothetical protein [Citrobacter freundii]OYQ93647.1 hypothetical protein B9P90_20765 [Citrobacter freundii]OYQ99611.1 hypothetical protein B9P89_21090 [Citrobacter freundii]